MATPSMDDVRSLGAKLDGAGLTDEEKAILATIAGRAMSASEPEVEGFSRRAGEGFLPTIPNEVVAGFARIFDPYPREG